VKRGTRVFGAVGPSAGRVEGLDRFEERAVIRRPLVGDTGLDGLATLEARIGIEVLAVPARVKRRPALRASGLMIDLELARGDLETAFSAAGDDYGFAIDRVPQRPYLFPVSQVGRLLAIALFLLSILLVLVVPIAFLAILHETQPSSTAKQSVVESRTRK
jgi:hypothetical protein